MRPDDVVRFKRLEQENVRFKRLLPEKGLNNDLLRMVAVLDMWCENGSPELEPGRCAGSC